MGSNMSKMCFRFLGSVCSFAGLAQLTADIRILGEALEALMESLVLLDFSGRPTIFQKKIFF